MCSPYRCGLLAPTGHAPHSGMVKQLVGELIRVASHTHTRPTLNRCDATPATGTRSSRASPGLSSREASHRPAQPGSTSGNWTRESAAQAGNGRARTTHDFRSMSAASGPAFRPRPLGEEACWLSQGVVAHETDRDYRRFSCATWRTSAAPRPKSKHRLGVSLRFDPSFRSNLVRLPSRPGGPPRRPGGCGIPGRFARVRALNLRKRAAIPRRNHLHGKVAAGQVVSSAMPAEAGAGRPQPGARSRLATGAARNPQAAAALRRGGPKPRTARGGGGGGVRGARRDARRSAEQGDDLRLLYHSGMRVGEVVALDVDDLESRGVAWCGCRGRWADAIRSIPLASQAVRRAPRVTSASSRPYSRRGARARETHALFLNHRGTRPHPTGLSGSFMKDRSSTGWPSRGPITPPHSLRQLVRAASPRQRFTSAPGR
jgi:integrase